MWEMGNFMTLSFGKILKVSVVSLSVLGLTACGTAASFKRNDKKASNNNEQLAGAQDPNCLALLGSNPYDTGDKPVVIIPQPGKDSGSGKDGYVPPSGKDGYVPPPPPPAGKDGKDTYVPPIGKDSGKDGKDSYVPGGYEPFPGKDSGKAGKDDGKAGSPGYEGPGGDSYDVPGKPNCNPGQHPGQQPGKDAGKDSKPVDPYQPVDVGQTPSQKPYPTQQPIVHDQCGKDGKLCDDGGPGQWPGQTKSGGSYDKHEVESCLAAFRKDGYDTKGMWSIDVKEVKAVNVLSRNVIRDEGNAHTLVIIRTVNVLGSLHYELLNPNALYCIRSVSVLQNVTVDSCNAHNVVFGKDVSVMSRLDARPVSCKY